MSDISLNSGDFLAIARAMDVNNNNQIDRSEGAFSGRVGNNNGSTGTIELATSLSKGDVVISSVSKESADKISDFFSDRKTNLANPSKLSRDGWLSREDLPMSDRMRATIDTNKDNKVSAKEFSEALTSGTITISGNGINLKETASNNSDPFAKPTTSGSVSSDPFASKPATSGSVSSDPFASKPTAPVSKPTTGDPFAKPSTPSNNSSNDPFARKF